MPDAPMNGTAAPAAAPSASPSAAPAAKSPSAPAAAGATPTGPQTAAPQTPAAKAEAARFKFKHGEQEFDWSQDDVQRNFQIGLNADKRMNDAARREKALAQREAALTGKNPEDILRAAGLDPDGWAFERAELSRSSAVNKGRLRAAVCWGGWPLVHPSASVQTGPAYSPG